MGYVHTTDFMTMYAVFSTRLKMGLLDDLLKVGSVLPPTNALLNNEITARVNSVVREIIETGGLNSFVYSVKVEWLGDTVNVMFLEGIQEGLDEQYMVNENETAADSQQRGYD